MSSADQARAAFAERFPKIADVLDGPSAVSSSLTEMQGDIVDATVNDSRLYGGDARSFAARQVDEFMAKPLRLFMERPTNAGLVSQICVNMHNALGSFLVENGHAEINRQVSDDCPNFLVVFGLGLGYHLEDLVMRTKARWLIVVEPITEFIAHSFKTVDWPKLFAHFEAQGGGVEVITKLDPGEMVTGIVRYMRAKGIPYVDGSFVFTHYPLWAFAEGRNRLYEAVEFVFINRGFFEDEKIMMTNTVTNFAAGPFWLMEGRPRLHRPELAVIVGAGPSLDEALPWLHEMRDRIVLFSAGTALRPLLRNGLVPDFHCELENVPASIGALEAAGKYGDLSKITLIASSTVDPRMPPMFGETIFFLREAVSSTVILCQSHLPIAGAAPTCVNTAVSMAAFLGFTDMALFGTDCGVREGGEAHAQGTVYLDVEAYHKSRDFKERFPIEVEGNFGGIVRTNWVYDACRLMLIEAIKVRGLNAWNGSDGALIAGALPRVPEAIEVQGPVIDRDAMDEALKRSLNWMTPSDFFAEADLAEIARKADTFYDDLNDVLDRLESDTPDFAAAYHAVRSLVEDSGYEYGQTDAISSGTLIAMPRLAMFFGFRITDVALREKLFAVFIKEFRAAVARMRDETRELFTRLSACVEAGIAEECAERQISA